MRRIHDNRKTRFLLGIAALLLLPGILAPSVPLGCLFAADCSSNACCSEPSLPAASNLVLRQASGCCCEESVIAENGPVADRESVKSLTLVKPDVVAVIMQRADAHSNAGTPGVIAHTVLTLPSFQLHRTVVLLL